MPELLMPQPTERLKFRPLNMYDAETWLDFIYSEEATAYFKLRKSREESEEWMERQMDRYGNRGDGMLAVIDKETGKMVGQCGLLWQEIDGEELLEVGYSFIPKYWGKGYATEAATAFYDLALELKLADFVVSVIHQDNIRSQRVAEKNGLKIWKSTFWKNFPVDVWIKDYRIIGGRKRLERT
jgi:RimJ/RimL family protein N-acetyltransferase